MLKKTHMRLRGFEFRVSRFEFQIGTRDQELETRKSSNRARFRCSGSDEHEPRTRITLVLLLLALMTVGATPVQKKVKQPKIVVSTHLDRTAIWVGDTLRYTVRAIHDRDVEFVLDSLKKESLNLAPFVVRDVAVRQGPFDGNKKVTEVTLQLATYESGQPELRIPSFTLFFFTQKPGLDKSGDTPAESFAVPATRVGLRSTLIPDARRPRDSREIAAAGAERWITAFALGLAGVAFLAVQTTRRLWTSPSVEKPKARQPTRRARRRLLRDFLRAIKSIGRDEEDQRRFYSEVSRFVREYLGQSLAIDTSGMTPDELAGILGSRRGNGLGAQVKDLLEKCEQVLYTRQGGELGRQWRDEVERELGRLTRSLRM
jgi:hypothetical protein